MRLRTRGSLNAHPVSPVDAYPVSCANRTSYLLTTNTGLMDLGEKQVTADRVTPDYFKRIKRGEIIFNDYSSTKTLREVRGFTDYRITSKTPTCSPVLYNWYRRYGDAFCYMLGATSALPRISVGAQINTGQLQDELWTNVLARRGNGSANLTEGLAEIDKSFHMVAKPLENVTTFLRDWRRSAKRLKGFEKIRADSSAVIGFASSEWLRFRYGINPLISDVRSGMQALKKDYAKTFDLHKVRANRTVVASGFGTGLIDWTPLRITYSYGTIRTYTVRALHIDKFVQSLWDDLGFTFHQTVGLAWELTHFSFVYDWFVNIGDLIYANIPRVNVQDMGGCVTIIDQSTSQWTPTGYTNIDPTNWDIAGGVSDSLFEVVTAKRRDIGLRAASLVIKSDFRYDTWNRCLDSAALIKQVLPSIFFGKK